MTAVNEFLLYRSYLTSLEDCVEFYLPPSVNMESIYRYCHDNRNIFMPYHKDQEYQNRTALPIVNLNGEHNDDSFINLTNTSLTEISFNKKTQHYYDSGLDKILDIFGDSLCRTHIINLKKGGYFRPHRDGPTSINNPRAETARVIICIDGCNNDNFKFLLDDKVLSLKNNMMYYINTFKRHCAFSFTEDCFFVLCNVVISQEFLLGIRRLDL